MKKKIVLGLVLALSVTVLSACSSAPTAPEPNTDAALENEAVSEELSDDPEEAVATSEEEPVVNEDTPESLSTGEAILTPEDAKAFKDYLTTNMDETGIMTETNGYICGGNFTLYDVNGDGHKDLIVYGALGLRTAMLTVVYLNINDQYMEIPFMGEPMGYYDYGLIIANDDYESAGAIRYNGLSVYSIDLDGHDISEVESMTSIQFFDLETGDELEEEKVLSEEYTILGEPATKEETDALYKSYEEKSVNVESHEITADNIEQFLK